MLSLILKTCISVFLIYGCTTTSDTEYNESNMNMENKLRIKGTLTKKGAVGYGNTYMMKIDSVIQGSLEQNTISIVVLAGDEMEYYFESHLSPNSVEISFIKHEEKVEYSMMPLTGFVDKNRTSWKIQQIK